MKILVTGGCGFVGSVLTPALLDRGHDVTVFDTMWFGNHLQPQPKLSILQGDIRAADRVPVDGMDAIIHLANIANDPSVELNPVLSWEVNALATMQLADRAARAGVKQFVFASSGSVYGVKEEPRVTEDLSLTPISIYNKTKMVAERVVLSYADAMKVHSLRPATVCGWSPRMRLDLSVNMLTMQALRNGRMTVFGGQQVRPNIHVKELVAVYLHFLDRDLPSGCYNAGFENLSLLEIAELVRARVPAEIAITGSNDPRSYRLDSSKLLATGFARRHSVIEAIDDIRQAVADGRLQDEDRWYNVRWMKQIDSEIGLAPTVSPGIVSTATRA